MSTGLVVVLAVAARGAAGRPCRLRLPGALLEIVAGIVLRPVGARAGSRPDATLSAVALLGPVVPAVPGRFRGRPAPVPRHASASRVAVSLAISLVGRGRRGRRAGRARRRRRRRHRGGAAGHLAGPGRAGAGRRGRAGAGRSGGSRSPGRRRARSPRSCCCRSGWPRATPRSRAGSCCWCSCSRALAAIGLAVVGVEHSMPLTALVARLADTSAQIRVRLDRAAGRRAWRSPRRRWASRPSSARSSRACWCAPSTRTPSTPTRSTRSSSTPSATDCWCRSSS